MELLPLPSVELNDVPQSKAVVMPPFMLAVMEKARELIATHNGRKATLS